MGDCQESTCLGQLELKNVSYEDVGLYVCKNSGDTTQVGAIYVYVKGNINVYCGKDPFILTSSTSSSSKNEGVYDCG